MPSFVDFAELKEKVPIEDVLPMLGIAGAGNSAQWRGSCPGCESGGDRALVVTPAKKAFYCFATRKGGDVIALVAHVQGISMKDAALAIAEYCGTVPVQESGNSNSTRNSTSSDTGNSTSPPERPAETSSNLALGIEKEWRKIAKNSLPTPEWLEGANITDKFSPNPFIANFGASLSSAVATACSTPLWGISRSGGNSVFDGGGGSGGGGGGGGGGDGGGGGH